MQATGTTVSRATGERLELFVETGALQLLERRIKPPSTLNLKAGEFYAREGNDKGQVSPRPQAGFLPAVPRAFRDTIPTRAAALKGTRAEPKAAPTPGYAALKPWLTAEPVIRREFPRRFAALAKDAAFREGPPRVGAGAVPPEAAGVEPVDAVPPPRFTPLLKLPP
jgi:hypothetical protein